MAQRKITILDKAPEPAHHPLGMTLGEKNSASYFDKPFTSPQSPFPELGLRNETRVSTTQVRLRTLLRQMLNVFAYRMTHLKICFI